MLGLTKSSTDLWPKRFGFALSLTLVVGMLVALVGWLAQEPALIRLQPFWTPIRANAVISLLILGGVMFGYELGYRRVTWLAIIPVLIGGLTLLQELSGEAFGIDELILPHFLDEAGPAPGRMAPAISTTIMLCGMALVSLGWFRMTPRQTLLMALVASVALSIGSATLVGYLLDLRAIYHWEWGSSISTSPFAAIAVAVTGLTMLALAWRENLEADSSAPSWLPLPVVVGSATVTIILWVGLAQQEVDNHRRDIDQRVTSIAGLFQTNIERQMRSMTDLAQGWSRLDTSAEIRAVSAQEMLVEDAICKAIYLVDANGNSLEIYPPDEAAILGDYVHTMDNARAVAMRAAEHNRGALSVRPEISASIHSPIHGLGYSIYAPAEKTGDFRGFVVGDFAYNQLIANIIGSESNTVEESEFRADFELRISIAGNTIYSSTTPGFEAALEERGISKNFSIYQRLVRFSLVQSEPAYHRERGFLPELALAAGFGITLLLGLSVHLARAANTSLRSAKLSNRKLQAENEERRRVEAMLKVSDERLRLALDSTQIGIFEWNLPSNQVYYSPGLWTMLDYKPGEVANTPEAWTSLIHPDDLGDYKIAVESQLAGDETFIAPEYRLRTGKGDWRWIYTRAKTVARAPSGAPLRIIGTLQDITERKVAEAALRESQAATRKLSLVASRTDNLVLIVSPQGNVEWVNESFSRVMEYTLDEIVGRNPVTFLVGPDSHRRTLRRIRAAMARGAGVTTDLVNYSKSGRKYHVHLEVQPVRDEAGGIENFIGILTDITARVETELALRNAKAEADAASRAKSEFLASMSHEIRTPMNGVIGMTSLLMDTRLDPEQRDFVNTIRTSGEALLTIINDILDFSKIESGKMELERLPFDLPTCVEEALDLFAMQAAAKRLDLAYHVEEDVPAWVMGDITRLRQILVNLVNNAVKFTASGAITITVRRLDRVLDHASNRRVTLEIAVCDTGIGIPRERISRLFKPFSQVDSSTTRKYGGTGLGLAICHRLSSLMGGGIRVESDVGEGSQFIFTVRTEAAHPINAEPLPPVPDPLQNAPVLGLEDNEVTQRRLATFFNGWNIAYEQVSTVESTIKRLRRGPTPGLLLIDQDMLLGRAEKNLSDLLESLKIPTLSLLAPGQGSVEAAVKRPWVVQINKPLKTSTLLRCIHQLLSKGEREVEVEAAPTRKKMGEQLPLDVLLVEDNAVNQKVALRFLERLGYRADAVGNGIEAVDAVANRRFDLVLMDLQMPEMDGFEASREIRRRFDSSHQPKIVALTANALQGDREECLEAGMDDYITKPVKLHELSEVIRRQFSSQPEKSLNPSP